MCLEGKARLIDVMWGVRKTVKLGYKVIGLRRQRENLWEEQTGKQEGGGSGVQFWTRCFCNEHETSKKR